ncbi:dimethylarginine dimethylaminohydrolase family protein [Marinoscillum furvescens]|nr:arginine deiminase family protein [Marinoscillum furvescens]
MIKLNIKDEMSPLEAVVLGTAKSCGGTPKLEEAYDPKSAEHIKAGTYPKEEDMVQEMEAFNAVFEKHGVTVYRPELMTDINQIFTRDIAFVIEDYLFKSNILPDRVPELEAIGYILEKIAPGKVITPPEEVHIEGGDVMIHGEHIFIGTYKGEDYPDYITARTNLEGVQFLKEFFPNKIVKEFDLAKSNTVAEDNALHLDCCFQPVGEGKAIIHREGFRQEKDYQYLVELFGEENLFHITKHEMYDMMSNIFSIAPDVVVSERNFTRLNDWLRSQGITVEEIPYAEIAKQEGLLRCSTLPLRRK